MEGFGGDLIFRDDVGDARGDAGGLARIDAELVEILPNEESNTATAPLLCGGFLSITLPTPRPGATPPERCIYDLVSGNGRSSIRANPVRCNRLKCPS